MQTSPLDCNNQHTARAHAGLAITGANTAADRLRYTPDPGGVMRCLAASLAHLGRAVETMLDASAAKQAREAALAIDEALPWLGPDAPTIKEGGKGGE